MSYADFLARKAAHAEQDGPELPPAAVNATLHDWQNELVRWAVRTRRAALWADTGLGKTFMQVEWARLSGARSLSIAPLAVCQQTVREAAKLGVTARYLRDDDGKPGVVITNYEMTHRFNADAFDAVVLDEASILKQSDGKTRTALIEQFRNVPARLACTATPAPNDPEELTNQAEFLGRMSRTHMLAAYFVHDDEGWRLKGHARRPMLTWMSTWAVALRRPSDLGYPDDAYNLPGLTITPHLLPVELEAEGQLFPTDLGGVGGRAAVRKDTLDVRCAKAAELIAAEPDEPWLIWCGLNDEAERMAQLTGALNITGSMSPEQKADGLLGFSDGTYRRIVTKPSLASFGLNWQHCARMVFVGLGDSYESYYQAIRRCYRYGQTRPVVAHVVLSELESQIAVNIARKERQATGLSSELVAVMRQARTAEVAA